jgi:hypothetical protein
MSLKIRVFADVRGGFEEAKTHPSTAILANGELLVGQ